MEDKKRRLIEALAKLEVCREIQENANIALEEQSFKTGMLIYEIASAPKPKRGKTAPVVRVIVGNKIVQAEVYPNFSDRKDKNPFDIRITIEKLSAVEYKEEI